MPAPKRQPATPKPEPVIKAESCSVCGLDWKRHGKNPTVRKCVELLKADLAKAPKNQWIQQGSGTASVNFPSTIIGNVC